MQCDVSIIIPAYNEANRIERALIPAIQYLKKQSYSSEIIVVSDGSNDETKAVTEKHKNEFENINIIEYFPNKGKGYAVKTGMINANGKYRLFMDADYAVPVDYIENFLNEIYKGYDIVIGSRVNEQSEIIKHQSFFREKLAKGFNLLQRVVLGLPIKDTQCGFKLFTSDTAEKLFKSISLNCSYFDAELLYIAYKNKFKIKEIGVKWSHDNETRLPITFTRSLDLLLKLFKIRFSKYEKFS
jgi:dolichyl-phosphate beta-glucosyltransferase